MEEPTRSVFEQTTPVFSTTPDKKKKKEENKNRKD